MAFDSRREVTVMFGAGNGDRKTWEFDGERWASRTTPNSPSARGEHGMAYDEDRGVVVLFGGRDSSGDLEDTWEYDGNDWTLKSPATAPAPSRSPGMRSRSARDISVSWSGRAPPRSPGPPSLPGSSGAKGRVRARST